MGLIWSADTPPATAQLKPPPQGSEAMFSPEFGQKVLLTVDTEEEFDWRAPFTRDRHGLTHVPQIARFQQFCEGLGASPVYLVDWPIANDPLAVEIIGDAVRRGTAEVGVQLHPWVNPPFEENVDVRNSFAGNLPPALEEAKFMALRDKIEEAFGTAPLSYRAGRYGIGPHSADLLKRTGIAVDTSVRALFDYSDTAGPDYSHHPLTPYWVDEERKLLELPVSTVYRGALRSAGPRLHRMQRHVPTFFAGFSRLGLLERIGLTPEGVTVAEGLRGVDKAIELGLPVLVLSFHSPSLAAGHTPFVETEAEVEELYRWFAEVYAKLRRLGVANTTISEIIAAVQ
jgi:hypothetical protein